MPRAQRVGTSYPIAATGARIAGAGDQLVTFRDDELRFHVGELAAARVMLPAPIVAVAHDGRRVAALDAAGSLHVLGEHARRTMPIAGTPRALIAGPNGAWLVSCAERAWLVRDDEQVLIDVPGAVAAAADPDGTVLVLGDGGWFATWRDGVLAERPPALEPLRACTPLGGGTFACAGTRHVFAFDASAAELELFELLGADGRYAEDARFAEVGAPFLAASPSGALVAWTAGPRAIRVARRREAALEIVLPIHYGDAYSQPLDAPLAVRGLAFPSETHLAIALDEGRGNLVDVATRTARKLDPHVGDEASRWIVFVADKALVAE